jgi:hypothetical protein
MTQRRLFYLADMGIATKRHKKHKGNRPTLKFGSVDQLSEYKKNFVPFVLFCGYFN